MWYCTFVENGKLYIAYIYKNIYNYWYDASYQIKGKQFLKICIAHSVKAYK